MTTVTFVTAFINVYNRNYDERGIEYRFNKFYEIAETGIQICVYASPEYFNKFKQAKKIYKNIKLMGGVDIKTTMVSKICSANEYSLPNQRCEKKDTNEFLLFINSKWELLANAIKNNPWNSSHFAWIDFSISYIFKTLESSQEQLKMISNSRLKESFITIGGWSDKKISMDSFQDTFDTAIWRFCGGFMLGDKESIREFVNLSSSYLPRFLDTYKKLTWEVNYWSWLETFTGWNPIWYYCMFDDSILRIPAYLYSLSLNRNPKYIHPYPTIGDNFTPSSSSHLLYKDKHILNTRFVNYLLFENGEYLVFNENRHIITKNMVSILDNNLIIPISNDIMRDDNIDIDVIIDPNCSIFGFEDIRLYEYNEKIRFIATNRNYAPYQKNRMVIGDYNIETLSYENCQVIDSPINAQYEKNWIPIIHNNEELFIYSWSPFQVGRINKNQLDIVYLYENTNIAPNFYRVRGSSTFIDYSGVLLGLVHFSDEGSPRNYYHMLVSLDKETLHPLKYSDPFYFQHIGIEFCTGFYIKDNKYIFWVSKIDRNACMMTIPMVEIPLRFSFFIQKQIC